MMTIETQPQTLTIGQIAQQAGVNKQTLRYYEREGLILEPARRESGYRAYAPEVVKRILFIKRAQELGFSLAEIKELLGLSQSDPEACQQAKNLTEQKILDIEGKLHDLERMRNQLVKLLNACDGQQPLDECKILNAFSD